MAAVFIPPPSPQTTSLTMATRRPLANVPNATNSPHRVGPVPAKRPRTANAQLDIPYGQPPPKKQVVEGTETENQASAQTRSSVYQTTADSKLFARRASNTQPSAFERRLVAARDKERQNHLKGARHEKPSAETLDSIRQWQRHYRKAFPQFVFYFDSITEDVRNKCSRQVIALGASEEKFFSRLVTHVVTSRPIPPEIESPNLVDLNGDSAERPAPDNSVQTVNPSLLERNADSHLQMPLRNDSRREFNSTDVLHRARQMGMKIWAIEKLQRMIATINDSEIAGHDSHLMRNNAAAGGHTKSRSKNDLSQVLRNELTGPSDRNHLSVLKDLIMFKGPFIYIHDMDEKTRPVMVREYPKVVKRQDGIWPQFRSAPLGKCPFVEEAPSKKEVERRSRQQKAKKIVPKPVPAQDAEEVKISVAEAVKKPNSLQGEREASPDDEMPATGPKQEIAQDVQPTNPISPRKSSESFVPPQVHRTGPFFHGREPAASGVQPSNITSAIRSQMVSSTAAAPGAKAGISKEVHELKRKVLEKGNGGFSAGGVPSSYRVPDIPSLKTTNIQGSRLSKLSPTDKLGNIEEDTTQSESNGATKNRVSIRKTDSQKKKERRRDPKPGYCENCRDKFDDFDEHIMTRKHRKHATNPGNWAELDALLFQLERPIKKQHDYV